MMTNKMDKLLNKYWEGETSLEEEKFIRTYFRNREIDPAHQPYRDLFNFFETESQITYPGKLEKASPTGKRKTFPLIRVAAAALVIIGLSVVVYLNRDQGIVGHQDDWSKFEVQDPEQAKEMAVEALAFVSVKLNKGEENMRTNMRALNKLPIR